MVADEHGVRVRHGETWSGLRWQDIEHVEVTSPRSWLRDGQIVVHPACASRSRWRGESDETSGATPQVSGWPTSRGVRRAARPHHPGRVRRPQRRPGRRPGRAGQWTGAGAGADQARAEKRREGREAPKPETAEKAEKAEPGEARRAEVAAAGGRAPRRRSPAEERRARPEARARGRRRGARRGGSQPASRQLPDVAGARVRTRSEPELGDEPCRAAARSRAASRESVRDRACPTPPPIPAQRDAGDGARSLVARVDDFERRPSRGPPRTPLIGPLIAAARHRARLSIDALSERTRIRPHVLECIEVDDFEACGGDFYARGTCARSPASSVSTPSSCSTCTTTTTPRRRSRPVRSSRPSSPPASAAACAPPTPGPRWSLLAACVLALASVWGVARFFNDTPQELVSPAPNVVDSAGLAKAEPAGTRELTLAPARGDRGRGEPPGRRTRPRRPHPVGRQARRGPAPAGHRPGALRGDRQQRQRGQGVLPRQAQGHGGRPSAAGSRQFG